MPLRHALRRLTLLLKLLCLSSFGFFCFKLGFAANEHELVGPVVSWLLGYENTPADVVVELLFGSKDEKKSNTSKETPNREGDK